jgi:tRNA (cytosine40_48-C5)-methyltransferase
LEYVPGVRDFMDKMEKPPTRYIRVNTIKIGINELEARLRSKGFELKRTAIPEVLLIENAPMAIGATNEYLLGYYYIQDLSSCIAVDALGIEKDHTVLDFAAAPGGKTTFMAQKMENTGSIIALEPNERRARSMSFNLARCGVYNTCILKVNGLEAEILQTKFDRVLLDAPCSCEGVIAKDATRKTSHTPQDVDYCADRQDKLIEAAMRMVKAGGIMVYSTCSFAPEENERVVDRLLQKFHNIRIEPIKYGSGGLTRFGEMRFNSQLNNVRRLYPHIHDTTGFFIARLKIG